MVEIKKKISRQLFFFILVLAIVPLALISFRFYYLARQELESTSFMHVDTVARDYASHVRMWLNERKRDISILSKLPSVRYLCFRHRARRNLEAVFRHPDDLLDDILNLISKQFSCFYRIYILDRRGEVVATTGASSPSFTRDIKRLHLNMVGSEKGVFPGDIHFHKGLGWFINLVLPIKNRGGSADDLIGYVVADMEISHSLEKLKGKGIGLGKTGEIYIVNETGIPITRLKYGVSDSDVYDQKEALVRTEAITKLLRREKGTSIYKNYAGNRVVGSYLWIPELNIGVVAEISTGEIMKPLDRLKFSTMVTLAVLLFFCALITYYVSKHVSEPIVSIARTAKEIAGGDLERRLHIRSSNEIGQLANTFNSMADQLSRTIKELKEKEASIRKAYKELKAAQTQLVQSEKMAAIGELVASVVHEMRNPLSSIKLNLQIIGRELDKRTRTYEHYKIAIDQVSHLDKMFTELLDFSKPIIVDKVPVLPGDLVDMALKQMREKFAARQIEIVRRLNNDLPAIEVDVDKILQVLINIFNNALDAMGDGGKIKVETRLSRDNTDTVLELIVSDNGSGIPEHQIEHIFSTFFTTKKRGTGLGLAIVRKIMEAHHAKIQVKSKVGEGTTIILGFPVTD